MKRGDAINRLGMRRLHEILQEPESPECSGGQWRPWSSQKEFVQHAVSNIITASNLAREVAGMVTNSVKNKEDCKGKCSASRPLSTGKWKGKNPNAEARHYQQWIQHYDSDFTNKENRQGNERRTQTCQRDRKNAAPLKRIDGNRRHKIISNEQGGGLPRANLKEELKKKGLRSKLSSVNRPSPVNLQRTLERNQQPLPELRRTTTLPLSTVSELSSSSDSKKVQIASSPSSSFSSSIFKINFEESSNSCSINAEAADKDITVHPSTSRIKVRQGRQIPLPSKIQARVYPSSSFARVFASTDSPPASPPPLVSKFSVRVVDATNANRPWVLTPSKPAKPVTRLTDGMNTNSKTAGKSTAFRHIQSPVLKSSKELKLSPSSLKFQPENNAREGQASVERSVVIDLKQKCQSAGSSRLKLEPLTRTLETSGPECKQYLPSGEPKSSFQWTDKLSQVNRKDLSSLRHLPATSAHTSVSKRMPSPVSRLVSTDVSARYQSEKNMIAPYSLSPSLHPIGMRAVETRNSVPTEVEGSSKCSATFPKLFNTSNQSAIRIPQSQVHEGLCANRGNQSSSIELEAANNIVENGMGDCTMCVPGCGSSVWPVLRRSWSCGNENICCCRTTEVTVGSCLRHMTGWINTLKNSKLKDEKASIPM